MRKTNVAWTIHQEDDQISMIAAEVSVVEEERDHSTTEATVVTETAASIEAEMNGIVATTEVRTIVLIKIEVRIDNGIIQIEA